ncbi:hypothetical protein KI688_004687 [Linnemannia hyalina]|uniref:Uncharacterized protein n=1 Tax=Linnemannia hyalina TaxID=64524 RepID=A0A9P8BRM1_9FUNG|nr:hypothetical protein KI688_004687 [Linnemannia hyalina]
MGYQERDIEHVSMAGFATKFEYHDRETAERDYRALIKIPNLSQKRRQRLFANMTTFNANRADGFWAKRATIAQAGVLAMKAAAVSMEVGHHQSKAIYQEYLPPQGVVEPNDDDAEDGDEDGVEDEAEAGDEDEDEAEDEDEDEAEDEEEEEAEAEAEAEAEDVDEDEDGGSADEAEEDFFNAE